ncbi:Mitochondrial associated endoribonuclease MAR1 (isochorismatase superfamily) [Phaffia rhodozyma]|uniref:Mitochondrial associated endoribonuclease MAR1 (Isochorismatase superfamily) n=1 Tax=Phaffia rhodozyma TaxID=264483 RepID=A0A0F7SVF8_PHARH|nr:Mitochondrial associated endoribonuclease MAR1 (isochorismatase superfamily) [Phaffia rhodozyma]
MLDSQNTLIFLCDIQTTFAKAIDGWDNVIHTARKLVRFAQILEIPVLATEQNPKALGPTDPSLDLESLSPEQFLGCFPKTKFSMVIPETMQIIQERKISNIILVGIESHICILQTALELLAARFAAQPIEVYVLADGVSSCHPQEVPVALARLAKAGAMVTTSESILFQLQADAARPTFKSFAKQVKEEKDGTRRALDGLAKNSSRL